MNRARVLFWIAAASLALAVFIVGCSSDSTPNDPAGKGGGVSIVVDTKTDVPIAGLPVAGGDDPRPVAAVVSEHGHQAEFVENELWIKPASQAELDAFLLRWNGAVIQEFDPSAVGLGGDPKHYLVRVETDGADTSGLTTLMEELSGIGTASLSVSSNAALELLSASAVEAGAGLDVDLDEQSGRGDRDRDFLLADRPLQRRSCDHGGRE